MERFTIELRNIAGVVVGFPESVTAGQAQVAVRRFVQHPVVAANLRSCVKGGGATICIRSGA